MLCNCMCAFNSLFVVIFFFLNDPAPTEIYPLPLHDALPISVGLARAHAAAALGRGPGGERPRQHRGRSRGALQEPPARQRVHVSIVPGGRSPAPSAPPRDEPPPVALRPARGGVDPKARRLHGALGLAVPVAAFPLTPPLR